MELNNEKNQNIITSLTAAALMIGLALSFNACTEQSPLSSTDESPFAQDNVQLIDLGDAFASLSKGELKVLAVVTPEDGGQLVLIKGKAFKDQRKDFKKSAKSTAFCAYVTPKSRTSPATRRPGAIRVQRLQAN